MVFGCWILDIGKSNNVELQYLTSNIQHPKTIYPPLRKFSICCAKNVMRMRHRLL